MNVTMQELYKDAGMHLVALYEKDVRAVFSGSAEEQSLRRLAADFVPTDYRDLLSLCTTVPELFTTTPEVLDTVQLKSVTAETIITLNVIDFIYEYLYNLNQEIQGQVDYEQQ